MKIGVVAKAAGLVVGIWSLVVRGALTLDLGVGRRLQPLGPLTVRIAAPREVVFEVVSGRTLAEPRLRSRRS